MIARRFSSARALRHAILLSELDGPILLIIGMEMTISIVIDIVKMMAVHFFSYYPLRLTSP